MNKYRPIHLQALFWDGLWVDTPTMSYKAIGYVDTRAEPPAIRFQISNYTDKPIASTYNSLVDCLAAMEDLAPIADWKPIMDDDDDDEPDPDDPNDPRNYELWSPKKN